jgi:hypothetical protein
MGITSPFSAIGQASIFLRLRFVLLRLVAVESGGRAIIKHALGTAPPDSIPWKRFAWNRRAASGIPRLKTRCWGTRRGFEVSNWIEGLPR